MVNFSVTIIWFMRIKFIHSFTQIIFSEITEEEFEDTKV